MTETYHFAPNLRFLRNRSKQSQELLSASLGIKRTQLNAYENRHTRNPTIELMMKISTYFNISLDVMLKVDLSSIDERKLKEIESRSNLDITGKELRVVVSTVNSNNIPNIEHVPIKAKAGYLTGYGDVNYINELPVFNLPNLPLDNKFRSFPCEGDSMYPFPEEAIIVGEYVDNWFTMKSDIPCIVVTKDEGIVFKLVTSKIEENRTMQLKSLNPSYKPYEVNVDQVCELWKYKCYISNSLPNSELSLDGILNAVNDMKKDINILIKRNNVIPEN